MGELDELRTMARVDELERKLSEDRYPLEDDEDLKDPFDDFREVQTMYGGTAFMIDGEIIHLPCGYAICKIGESNETVSQV